MLLVCKTHFEEREYRVLNQIINIKYLEQCQMCACACNKFILFIIWLVLLCQISRDNIIKCTQVETRETNEPLNIGMCGTFICRTCP